MRETYEKMALLLFITVVIYILKCEDDTIAKEGLWVQWMSRESWRSAHTVTSRTAHTDHGVFVSF